MTGEGYSRSRSRASILTTTSSLFSPTVVSLAREETALRLNNSERAIAKDEDSHQGIVPGDLKNHRLPTHHRTSGHPIRLPEKNLAMQAWNLRSSPMRSVLRSPDPGKTGCRSGTFPGKIFTTARLNQHLVHSLARVPLSPRSKGGYKALRLKDNS